MAMSAGSLVSVLQFPSRAGRPEVTLLASPSGGLRAPPGSPRRRCSCLRLDGLKSGSGTPCAVSTKRCLRRASRRGVELAAWRLMHLGMLSGPAASFAGWVSRIVGGSLRHHPPKVPTPRGCPSSRSAGYRRAACARLAVRRGPRLRPWLIPGFRSSLIVYRRIACGGSNPTRCSLPASCPGIGLNCAVFFRIHRRLGRCASPGLTPRGPPRGAWPFRPSAVRRARPP